MSQIYTIPCNRNEDVFIHAIPGHYVTASAHLNYYVGTSDIKHNRVVSVEAAKLLAEYYSVRNMDVDTVLCLYETQALGAYMAQEQAPVCWRPTRTCRFMCWVRSMTPRAI